MRRRRRRSAPLAIVVGLVALAAPTATPQARDGRAESSTYGAGLSPPFAAGAMGGYYTFDEVVSVLDQLRAQYPLLVSAKQSLGTSIEGRDLWAVKISDNPDAEESEPEVRFDSLHHGHETLGLHTVMWFMFWLLEEAGTDPLATYLVQEREIWCVPVVNPDGYVYNETIAPGGGGLWRKNRRDNGPFNDFGVDLNRNYPYQWAFDNDGSSPFPSSSNYRGTAAASEPEVAAMVAFLSAREFRTALSMHTFGQLWLSPFGYDTVDPVNADEYDEIAALAVAINGYGAGPAAELLPFKANGVTIDYDHAVHGTLAWSPEIGSVADGHWPPAARIVPIADQNLAALQRTALAAGAYVHVADMQLVEEGDGDGGFDPGETLAVTLDLRNSGTGATGTAVTATLTSASPWVSIVDGAHDFGAVPAFSSADNGADPLRLAISPSIGVGTSIPFTISVTYEGWVQTFEETIRIEVPNIVWGIRGPAP